MTLCVYVNPPLWVDDGISPVGTHISKLMQLLGQLLSLRKVSFFTFALIVKYITHMIEVILFSDALSGYPRVIPAI